MEEKYKRWIVGGVGSGIGLSIWMLNPNIALSVAAYAVLAFLVLSLLWAVVVGIEF